MNPSIIPYGFMVCACQNRKGVSLIILPGKDPDQPKKRNAFAGAGSSDLIAGQALNASQWLHRKTDRFLLLPKLLAGNQCVFINTDILACNRF